MVLPYEDEGSRTYSFSGAEVKCLTLAGVSTPAPDKEALVAYQKPLVVDYGTITEHTFILHKNKSFGFEDDLLEEEDDVVSP
jgi:hypothetical protein